MSDWEARYRALCAQIADPTLIDNAEKFVQVAYRQAYDTALPFQYVFNAMLQVLEFLQRTKQDEN